MSFPPSFPPYPTVPSPAATWSDGPVLVSELRGQVGNGVTFLANRPRFTGTCTTGPNIGGGGFSPVGISLDTEIYDTWSGHWQADPHWWYATQPGTLGWYVAESYMPFNQSSTTQNTFCAGIQYGTPNTGGGGSLTTSWGEQHPVGSNHFPGPNAAELVPVTITGAISGQGSAIQAFAAQNSGSGIPLASAGPAWPRLSLRWVCASSGTAGLAVPANPPWPAPPEYITAKLWLNPNIANVLSFLAYPPVFRGYYQAGTYTMPSGSWPGGTLVPLDTATFDNYSVFSASTSAWTAPVAGVYYTYGQVSYASASVGGNYSAGLSAAGGTTQWGTSVQAGSNLPGVCVSVTRRLRLTAGQTVTLLGAQSTGSSLQLVNPGHNTGPQSKLIIVWESA